jgi:hypothetical protein
LSFSKSRRKEEEEDEAIPLGISGFYFRCCKKKNQYNSWFSKGREAKVRV